MELSTSQHTKSLRMHDLAIFSIMAVLAGCGLIYEYLLSHYTGRVLGAIETVIFSMIGIMIVSMGIGAFASRHIKCAFTGFAWLEVMVALLGVSSVLIIGGVHAFVYTLPQLITETYGLPPDLAPSGGFITDLIALAGFMPYVIGFLLGLMIGMEIPLMARIRETVYGEHLKNNAGDIYGMDYIGAGAGAALWVIFMLAMEPTLSAALTATANIIVGLFFYFIFYDRIRWKELLLLAHVLVAIIVLTVGMNGAKWSADMEDVLYKDKVLYRINTQHQHVVITERIMNPASPTVLTLYINGRTQFSSNDEHMYHSMLTYPVLAASARHDTILIIGGGDGLALRDTLKWDPQEVVLIDLDQSIVDFFTRPYEVDGKVINQRLLALNEYSFSDPRVDVQFGDAYQKIDALLQAGRQFDSIIVDLPDPNHPDLNKLYTARFYNKLRHLLAGDGAIAIQSTSPYHAREAFISIGKTVEHAGFAHVQQYHHNVPSFGEWGWTIATKNGLPPRQRLARLSTLPVDDGWISKDNLLAAFAFSKNFFAERDAIKINRLGTGTVYEYYRKDWEIEQGIYHEPQAAHDDSLAGQ